MYPLEGRWQLKSPRFVFYLPLYENIVKKHPFLHAEQAGAKDQVQIKDPYPQENRQGQNGNFQ